MTEEMYYEAIEKYGSEFDAGMGAEAVKELLKSQWSSRSSGQLREELPQNPHSETKTKKAKQAP